MPRPQRTDVDDGWHHVMNRGVDRADVFLDDNDRVQFGHRLAEIHERFGVETHAYCLMDNHYHLLLHCPFGGLSRAMQLVGSVYTRHVNDRVGRDGPLFRGRFHSRLITTDAHLVTAVRYIHRNALDLSGVDRVDAYRWSSHRTYLGHRTPPPWMFTSTVLAHFAGDAHAFHAFVSDEPVVRPVADLSAEQLEMLIDAISLALAQQGVDDGGRLGARSRAAALAWADQSAGVEHARLMELFGVDSSGALRSARSRARRQLATDDGLRVALDRATALVFDQRVNWGLTPVDTGGQRDARAAS
jgi:REP element-mobilizing transposase RayT